MAFSDMEYLQMLARPDTSTEEITVIASNLVALLEHQQKVMRVLSTLIDLVEGLESKIDGKESD